MTCTRKSDELALAPRFGLFLRLVGLPLDCRGKLGRLRWVEEKNALLALDHRQAVVVGVVVQTLRAGTVLTTATATAG